MPLPQIIGKDGKRMTIVPAGFFRMGTGENEARELAKTLGWKPEWFADEIPSHFVYLDAYYIDETPVTNLEYKKFLLANPRVETPTDWDANLRTYAPGKGNHPVVCVSWDDANAYAQWAGKRLPTEAEWEKAARGVDGRVFPWGNRFDPARLNSKEANLANTTPVTRYSPQSDSPFGVSDMVGNTWEWCADWYAANYYAASPERNPRGPTSGDWRVLRGGAWDAAPDLARCASRDYIAPEMGYATVGFRCVTAVR